MGSRKARTDRNAGPWTTLIGVGVTLIVVLMLALLFCTLSARAHSWYPSNCCAERHCHPVACEEITKTHDGYLWHGVHFHNMHHQWSPDGDCHVCLDQGPVDQIPYCIFTPMPVQS